MDYVLKVLFYELNNSSLDYVVARNFSDLYDTLPEGDIDILVQNESFSFKKVNKILMVLDNLPDVFLYQTVNHSNISLNAYFCLNRDGISKTLNLEFRRFLVVDSSLGFKNFLFPYSHNWKIGNNFKKFNDICILDDELYFSHLFYEVYCDGKKKYIGELERLRETLGDTIVEGLKNDIMDQLCLIKNRNAITQETHQEHQKSKFTFRSLFKLYLWNMIRIFFSLILKVKYFFNAPGKLIVLVGPDGVGKTTVANEFAKSIQRAFPGCIRMHLGNRPRLLFSRSNQKDLANELTDKSFNDQSQLQDTRSITKFQKIYRLLRYSFHVVDYIAQYWVEIYPKLVRGNAIVCERYVYDYFLAHERYIPGVPYKYKVLLSRLVPKPDFICYVMTDPNLVMDRKNELSLEQLIREQKRYFDFVQENGYWTIENNSSLPFAVNSMRKAFFSSLRKC